ncbi:MAG: hypothetical protein ACHRHE_22845, partial [Tepidisphaerales bacterium]
MRAIRVVLFLVGAALLAILIRGFWQSDCILVRASENVDALVVTHRRGSIDLVVAATSDFKPEYDVGIHYIVRPADVAGPSWPYWAWWHWLRLRLRGGSVGSGGPLVVTPRPEVHVSFADILVRDVYQSHERGQYDPGAFDPDEREVRLPPWATFTFAAWLTLRPLPWT